MNFQKTKIMHLMIFMMMSDTANVNVCHDKQHNGDEAPIYSFVASHWSVASIWTNTLVHLAISWMHFACSDIFSGSICSRGPDMWRSARKHDKCQTCQSADCAPEITKSVQSKMYIRCAEFDFDFEIYWHAMHCERSGAANAAAKNGDGR